MMIMPSNNLSGFCHYIAGKHPGRIGMMNSPLSWKNPPQYMPYALDNGAFTKWDKDKFIQMLWRTKFFHRPLWIVVPDVVGDAEETFRLWQEWYIRVAPFAPLAFSCQDGMEPQDVPQIATCCFIGGTTKWKLSNAHRFKGVSPLLHIGRVSTLERTKWAEDIGADSIDGSGWFRGKETKSQNLRDFFYRDTKPEKRNLDIKNYLFGKE